MRFPMLVLATAIAALACEKGAPLSNSAANPAPAPAPADVSRAAAPAAQAGVRETAGTERAAPSAVPAAPADVGVHANAIPPSATAPLPSPATSQLPAAAPAQDEGNGEPMDDVDDEEVSATDKSGVDAVTNEEPASGPVDDSEGADIELRE